MYSLEMGDTTMLTYVELTNYKSFGKIKFDFRKKKGEFKRFIAIYGENGSGKSNFVSSIGLLSQLMTSFISTRNFLKLKEFLENKDGEPELRIEDLLNNIESGDLTKTLASSRMIDCDDNTTVKYGFVINSIEGYYLVSFNDNAIIHEELYYLNNKQRGMLFNISENLGNITCMFSSYLFRDKKYEMDIRDLIDRYWGKHSFMSLILNEQREKNHTFIENNILPNLLAVIDSFMHIFILCKTSKNRHVGIITGSTLSIDNFECITIEKNNKQLHKQLKLIEQIVNDFYTQTYSDIVKVYYRRVKSWDKDSISYEPCFQKIIAGEIREIPFNLESAGTQSVLSILRAIIDAINGHVVIYDEIDDGIHDLLMNNILLSVQDAIKGQLIITTHNTYLLENLSTQAAYIIYTDNNGNKEGRCLADYGIRIQANNNARKLYLSGVFGGIPYSNTVDYSSMYFDTDLEE